MVKDRYTKQVQLFEAFLQAREVAEEKLNEAGLTFEEAQFSEDEALQEAGTTSDFATYLNDKATKRLMWGYNQQGGQWRRYSRTYSLPDFKPISFVRLTEMQGLLPVKEGGEYKDSQIDEIVGPSLTLGTFGRLFSLSRKAIINDDLNQLRDRPAAFGRAAARSLGKDVTNQFVANPNTYDGTALFHNNHGNLMATAESEDALATAMTKLRVQTEPNGERIGLRGRLLVIPPELEVTTRRILNSTVIPQPSQGTVADLHANTVIARGGANVMAGAVDYVVDDYLTDPNNWYLFADQNEAPVLAVGFLNGVETPDIFLRDPGMRNVLGGSDPYTMEFDEIWWKIRHDWGVGILDWRGAVASIVP